MEVIIALNRQLNDTNTLDTSKEGIYDVAFDWIALVDKNNQGGIDLTEFYLSFSTIDDFVINDQDVVNIFRMYDCNNDGDISVQELAKAIKTTIEFIIKEFGQDHFDNMVSEGLLDDDNASDRVNDQEREIVREKSGVNNQSLK